MEVKVNKRSSYRGFSKKEYEVERMMKEKEKKKMEIINCVDFHYEKASSCAVRNFATMNDF